MNDQEWRDIEDEHRNQVTALSTEQRQRYYRLEQKHLRDPDTYAALNWFLVGLHHFYLGRYWRGAINIAVVVLGLMSLPPGLLLIAAVFLVELVQLFRSQSIVKRFNLATMRRLLDEVQRG